MSKRIFLLTAIFFSVVLISTVSIAQEEETVYTYVSHWGIPRAQWSEAADFFKGSHPIFERLLAAGTIVAWGNGTPIVHRDEGNTHGTWFAATSLTNIEKALAEFATQPPNPVMNDASHHDHLFRSLIHMGRTTSTTTGYAWGSGRALKAGKSAAWLDFFNKTSKPVFDKLVSDGTLLAYEVSADYVHTGDPGRRTVWYMAPSMEAFEKARAALAAAGRDQGPSYGAAQDDLVDFSQHQDGFWFYQGYAHK